ncbi:MAG: hypothetical protein HGB36_02760 [Chlorobiaceae bacterium]|nr:hypothetical protein [Chlorobiaceae bacterium]
MTLEELQNLLEPKVQDLLARHAANDPAAFALQYHGHRELPVRAMAEQLSCGKKALKKLARLSTSGLLYTSLALEQCSGERMAGYRATLLSGKRVIDLSGGLGIDSMFLARVFQEVVYCERDEVLCALAAHNMRKAGISNVVIRHGESMELLASCPDDFFDWIFADPARREQGRKSVGLHTSSPDVIAGHDLMRSKARHICIKASPALETSALQEVLPSLSSILVVSVQGECKEIMLFLDRERPAGSPVSMKAVCLGPGQDEIVEITGGGDTGKNVADAVKEFFYEPDPAIIKSKLTGQLALDHGLGFVNRTVDFLTSDTLIEPFPGRSFETVDCVPYKPKTFATFLDRHHLVQTGASIQRRDFPHPADELRKKFRLKENALHFLFFTRNRSNDPICIYCRRLS